MARPRSWRYRLAAWGLRKRGNPANVADAVVAALEPANPTGIEVALSEATHGRDRMHWLERALVPERPERSEAK